MDLTPTAIAGAPARIPARGRRILAVTLTLLAGLLAFLSVWAIWADRQVTDNRAWRDTAEALIQDPDIREALAAELTDALYANVNVAGDIRRALPDRLGILAEPLAGALRQEIQAGVDDALQRPAVQRLFVEAVARAHATAMAILEGDDPIAVDPAGTVTLDLRRVLVDIADRVGLGDFVAEELPPGLARIELVQSDDLRTAQSGLNLLRDLAIVLPILAFLFAAAAIWVAVGRRREAFRLLGVVLLVAAVLVPVVRAIAGDITMGAIDPAPAADPAARRVWEIGTALLDVGARSLGVYAVALLVAAFLAGPTRAAVWLRRHLRPFAEPQWTYPAGALVILLILWWGPTAALRRWLPALILVLLMAAGVEVLRRQVMREAVLAGPAPEGSGGSGLRAAVAGVGARIGRLRDRHPEDRTAALERLARLRDQGALTPEEFEAEKRRILDGGGG